MNDPEQDEAAAEPAYGYKPSLMGSPWLLRLTPDALAWTVGRQSGQLPYRDIASIRMSFRPITMQAKRYITEIRGPGAPKIVIASTSWKNMVEYERKDAAYAQFVTELHRRIVASGGTPRCHSGLPPFLYWPGVAVYAAVLVGLVVLIVRALQVPSYEGAAFIAAFLGLFAWQLGRFFKLNRPGLYRVDAPPADLLPRA